MVYIICDPLINYHFKNLYYLIKFKFNETMYNRTKYFMPVGHMIDTKLGLFLCIFLFTHIYSNCLYIFPMLFFVFSILYYFMSNYTLYDMCKPSFNLKNQFYHFYFIKF